MPRKTCFCLINVDHSFCVMNLVKSLHKTQFLRTTTCDIIRYNGFFYRNKNRFKTSKKNFFEPKITLQTLVMSTWNIPSAQTNWGSSQKSSALSRLWLTHRQPLITFNNRLIDCFNVIVGACWIATRVLLVYSSMPSGNFNEFLVAQQRTTHWFQFFLPITIESRHARCTTWSSKMEMWNAYASKNVILIFNQNFAQICCGRKTPEIVEKFYCKKQQHPRIYVPYFGARAKIS